MRFLLASNSPRRRQLLALAGMDFVVRAPDVDESLLPGEGPVDYVLRVSRAKALVVASAVPSAVPPALPQPYDPPIDVILAADTTVVDGSHILGKPSGAVEAEAMLRRLRNRTHQVYTGLALYLPLRDHLIQDWCVTDVPMRSYSDAEMAAYIATGDPMDKAGAYAIQHAEFRPVERLAGCYANVVGLPFCHLTRMLKKIDIALLKTFRQPARRLSHTTARFSRKYWMAGNRLVIRLDMKFRFLFLAIIFILATGCKPSATATPIPTLPPTRTPAQPSVSITSVPDAGEAARAFLNAWQVDDYPAMYAQLTAISKDAIKADEFEKHYRGIATEMALSGVEYEILSSLVLSPQSAQVSYEVVFHSTLVNDIRKDTLMNLSLEQGEWRVQWDDSLVMPELAGGNYLSMERFVPARANIYDRNGHALVAQADATAIGLIPRQINPEQEQDLFSWLVEFTGLSEEAIRARYANFPPDADWYLPLGEVQANDIAQNFELLSSFSGLILEPYKARYYFDGGVAPHVIGYVTTIQAGEEEEYLRKGYRRDERVGQSGLEQWGEEYLSGKRGGALYVINTAGNVVTRLGQQDAQASQAIYTTISRDFQEEAQRALSGFRGAAVVLERDTGRVLAMVSSPSFDPNAFEPTNRNFSYILEEIFSDPATPTFNRATQGQYPPGSAFKIITMAAALESGSYTPESTYQCGYFFTELAGVTLHDWTYDHFQSDGQTIPSGLLTLPQGLMRSCNPYFWHIGLDLYTQGKTKAIADMARGFGLGLPTGIEGIPEATGNIPEPASEVDATNLAIGQGDTLVTPLQAATFIAALGNGGTLYRPQLVEKLVPPDGDPVMEFKPIVNGKLPISAESLKAIQDAMRGVIVSTKPYGTAWHRFTGLDIPVAGKTGTAESGSGEPHAWFVGYTFAEKDDMPDLAIAVIVENIGEGSDYAAPIFRRIVEAYFYGKPARLYPWESGFYVVRTPEPAATETPAP